MRGFGRRQSAGGARPRRQGGMRDVQVPVLIVGGGPVGLVASVCLSRLGVASLLIERHPGTTIHPKARNLNLRTMEIVRPWGIDAELFEGALPRAWTGCFVYATTLAGRELGRMQTASFESERASPLTPVTGVLSSQDVYEPVIRRLAERLGPGELRFHHELEELAIEGDRARSRVRRLDDGSVVRGREPLSPGLRRLVERGAPQPRHRDGGSLRHRALRQRVLPRRSLALDRRSSGRPLLRRRGRRARRVPAARRSRAMVVPDLLRRERRGVRGVHGGALSRLDPPRGGIARGRGRDPLGRHLDHERDRRRRVPPRPGPARRRRRASAAAHRRVRHEHRRAGRPQPGVEDRGCARGLGWPGDPRQLRGRAAAGGANQRRSLAREQPHGRAHQPDRHRERRRFGVGGRGVASLRQLHRHGPRLPLRRRGRWCPTEPRHRRPPTR